MGEEKKQERRVTHRRSTKIVKRNESIHRAHTLLKGSRTHKHTREREGTKRERRWVGKENE